MIPHVTTRSGATVAGSVGSRISSPSMVAFLRSPVSCGPTPTLPVTFVSGLPKVTSPFASPRTANPAARPSMKPALGPQAGHPASVVVVDRLHPEQVVVGAEHRVDGGRPLPVDAHARRVGAERATPYDGIDSAREVERYLECQPAHEVIAREPRRRNHGFPLVGHRVE